MSELTEAQQLQADIEAQTAAFLRDGGAITKLDYAGVPIEAEYGQQVFLDPEQLPAPVPTKPAYGRLYQAPDPLPAPTAEAPQPLPLPVIEPAPAPARFETVADWCERVAAKSPSEPAKPAYGRMDGPPMPKLVVRCRVEPPSTTPEQDAAFAESLDELLTPEPEKPCIIAELRAIRADARAWLARLDRSFPR